MKKPTIAVRPYRHNPKFKFLLDLRAYGKGRKFFTTKADADAECRRQRTLLERHSRAAIGLSQREMSDFITARDKLAKHGKTINDASEFYLDHLERVSRHGITVKRLAAELLEAKKKAGRSAIYLRDLRNILLGYDNANPSLFNKTFGDRAIAGITVEELGNFLSDLPGSLTTRKNFRANIGVLFSYATKRRILGFNPVSQIDKPTPPQTPPEILSPDELRSLLQAAKQDKADVLPMLALGAFAGVRDAEIKRLDWAEVRLDRGFVEIKAAKAKSARRRLIPIQPNLAAWLLPYSKKTGLVVPEGYRNAIERVRKAGGMTTWKKNALRHSFASYRLAATSNAPLVASELGHTSPTMLYGVYRELVTPDEAARYWLIVPPVTPENVVSFAAQAQG